MRNTVVNWPLTSAVQWMNCVCQSEILRRLKRQGQVARSQGDELKSKLFPRATTMAPINPSPFSVLLKLSGTSFSNTTKEKEGLLCRSQHEVQYLSQKPTSRKTSEVANVVLRH